MKHLIFALLLCGLFLNVGSSPRADFYQVISSHPHDLSDLDPYIDTVYQNGRLWVVQLKKEAPSEVMANLRPLSGGEKSYIYENKLIRQRKNLIKDPLKSISDKVDAEAIRSDIEALASYKTRYAGTPENQQAVKWAEERFQKMGYEVTRLCYKPTACSVVAEKKGKSAPDNVIMVMGHIDSVGEAFAGADDNASGTAVLLEMARVLKDHDNEKTFRFFITNGEELGLYGAVHYANKLRAENKMKDLSLVINMDMVGFNSNGIVELETNPEFEPLAKWYADLAARYTKLKTKITLGAWGSDHVPFLKGGAPAILTIEDWDTKTPCYHQSCDTPDTVNYEYAAEIGKLNVSAVLNKDEQF